MNDREQALSDHVAIAHCDYGGPYAHQFQKYEKNMISFL
jgi:hypothetical protein